MSLGIVCMMSEQAATVVSFYDVFARPTNPGEIGNTAQIQSAIRYQGVVKIVAFSATFDLEISFSPNAPQNGHYLVKYKPHGPTEHGKILHVHPVASGDDSTYKHLSVLAPYEVRFAVRTEASARPHNVNVWLLGLSNVTTIEDESETENEQP